MILNLFDKKNNNTDNDESIDYSKIIALLVHAAKIDENYTDIEKKIIKKALVNLKNISSDQAEKLIKHAPIPRKAFAKW